MDLIHFMPYLATFHLPSRTLHGSRFSLPVLLFQLSLNKSSEVWWKCILEGEEEIDVDKLNRERSMASVDEEEHAVLDRLTFDYHQKLQGKPQSHEMVRVHIHRA